MFSFINPPPSPFEPPSTSYRILSSPLKYSSQILYGFILLLRGPAIISKAPSSSQIRLVCVSDTHTHKPASLPPGDVLIHAGDLTNAGTVAEIQDQIDWLSALPYEHKIAIAGNHDSYCDPRSRRKEDDGKRIHWQGVHYLQHSSIKLSFPSQGNRELSFYGAPQIPQCGGVDFAFQYRRSDDAWSGTIPVETDVLMTHTPPRHHLDLPAGLGCGYLLKEVWRVRPKIHVFGHVHAGYGKEDVFWDEAQEVYEKICARKDKGFIRDVFAVEVWLDLAKLAIHGALRVLWSRIWGGEGGHGQNSVFVNCALLYRSSGRLGNAPQIINI